MPPLMNEELYRALVSAGAGDELATAAARSVASYDSALGRLEQRLSAVEGRMTGLEGRMAGLDSRMIALEGRLTMLMWALGLNVAFVLGVAGMVARLLWRIG